MSFKATITACLVSALAGFAVGYYTGGEYIRRIYMRLNRKMTDDEKKDDRIIECNGMISDNCKKCIFGRQPVWNVIECFAPDFDGVPTIGLKRMEEQDG